MVVMIMITQTRLNGIHEAVVLDGEFKDCTAALITPPAHSHRRLIYNGLVLQAIVLRHDGPHIDLILLE
ncbi:Unknown (Maco150) [Spodoptera exigua multiple nucleopolyhedrovirus]|nr:Unknown (Maco150) [Spodoptera exigua multiple nucleopolyhedrovirus]CDG72600.1 Unknown (Maco150) [Spodoptera exigua multiple nucleopolyhedrovirus]CDG72737.1 Unknown (Maco150) [Spodoptera exigua multiple nucleopolyhedrovirus]CDG72874.1 Unknown (Maco150) [Spodoptera exigua multiple nucleopolyhedrovirus]CDG73026.1 Unknown (Maco150) [Spodoptera exigua multiple nucleopolyhedrovirus]